QRRRRLRATASSFWVKLHPMWEADHTNGRAFFAELALARHGAWRKRFPMEHACDPMPAGGSGWRPGGDGLPAQVRKWASRAVGWLRCDHDWSYPFASRFGPDGSATDWISVCNRCGRHRDD